MRAVEHISTDLVPGTEIAEYVIEEVIGRGGMSVVYRAAHPVIGSRVAIKVLAMDRLGDPLHASRFIQEARTANEIRHRNIVDVFTIGRLDTGQIYLVMEYLDGVSLSHHLATHGTMSIADTVTVLDAIARALDAAHAKGVVHRDVKPGNIFLLGDPDTGRITQAKLLDFGVAKLLETSVITSEHRTETGSWVGTPAYMAPEQWNAKDVDARADIYSFGVVAYQMLTGRMPYSAPSVPEMLVLQQTELPAPASQLAPVPPAVDALLVRAMHKDPEQRFARATELVGGLAAATSLSHLVPASSMGLPAVAIAPTPVPSARRAVVTPRRRGQIWMSLAVAGLVLAIAAIALRPWEHAEPAAAAAPPETATAVVPAPAAITAPARPTPAATAPAEPPVAATADPAAPVTQTDAARTTKPAPARATPPRRGSRRPATSSTSHGDVVPDMPVNF